jgi:predicted branched-subunit amino acid permease
MREPPVIPALILGLSFVGFGALAKSTGFGLLPAVYATIFIFALPGQVVLVDQVTRGLPLLTTALAVSLTSVRFLPLTLAILPQLRRTQGGRPVDYVASHFVAVTLWIESMRRIPTLPYQMRVAYYFGLALILVGAATAGTVIGYAASGFLPKSVAASLLFVTPLYFMLGMMSAVRRRSEYIPLVLGFALGPVFHILVPSLDLIVTGVIGGSAAYFLLRRTRENGTTPLATTPSEP